MSKEKLPVTQAVRMLRAARERIYINGGKRGYLVGIAPQLLVELLKAELVDVAV